MTENEKYSIDAVRLFGGNPPTDGGWQRPAAVQLTGALAMHWLRQAVLFDGHD
jgi:hypothetical protein